MLKVEDVVRPLHVSEVQLKAGRFSWPRPCLLLVTATAVVLLDVQSQGELEARDGSHASIQLAVRAAEVRPHGAPWRAREGAACAHAGGSMAHGAHACVWQRALRPPATAATHAGTHVRTRRPAPLPPQAADPCWAPQPLRPRQVVDLSLVPGGLRLEYKAPGALKVRPRLA